MTPSSGDTPPGFASRALQTLVSAISRFPRLYLQIFLNGFCRYVPLPIIALILVGFASGLIGDGMGIQFLFFHYEPWKGFAAGFFFSLVFACILLVGYLLWKRDSSHEFATAQEPLHSTSTLFGFAEYAGVVLAGFVISAVALTVAFTFVSYAARSHVLSSASAESGKGAPEYFSNPATMWTESQLSDTGESQFIEENVTLRYWPFAVGLICGTVASFAFLKAGASEWWVRGLPRSGPNAGTLRVAIAQRYRTLFLIACLLLGCGTVILLGGGQMNESATIPVRLTTAAVVLVLIGGSWAALRWGRASGFFAFVVVHLLAAHFALTWLAFQTSGESVRILGRRIEFGGWWLSGLVALLLGAIFLVGTRRGFRDRVQTLFGSAGSHLRGPQGARIHRAAATLTGCTFAFFFVSATGLLKIEMLVNPAVTSLYLFFLAVLAYGTFAYIVPRGMKVSVALAAGLFLLVGGVQRYKYPIRYPDHASTSAEIDPSLPVMDYAAPLDLEKQLVYEREQQQGGINEVARLATREGGKDENGNIRYPHSRIDELRARYAKNDPHQRLIPLKLFTPDPKAMFRFIPEFPSPPPGEPETILLPPSKFGFAGHPPEVWDAGKTERAPMVIVAVSGGAMRAAAWTHAILAELELLFAEKGIDFPSHVRMIAGASGGMFGAGHYVVSLPPPSARGNPETRRAGLDSEYQALVQDSLTPLMNQMVFGDIPNLFSPWPHRYDRGRALEDAWAQNGLDKLTTTTFHDLRKREQAGWCPSLVVSPMIVEDGRRLLFSNLDLRYVVSNDGRLIRTRDPYTVDGWLANYSREGFEFFRMFPGERDRLRISTAVRLSASFPLLSPAAALPTHPRRRVVDAGYYDNFGVSLAAAWLFSSAHADWIKRHASKVLLIQVRAYDSERSRTLGRVGHGGNNRVFESNDSSLSGRAVEDLVTPLVGVNKARESANSFRNDEQLELLTRSVLSDIGVPFTVLNMELKVREDLLPLNWYMTRQMTDGIRREAKNLLHEPPPNPVDNRRLKDYLLSWWNPSLTPATK